ncbi:methyl-accepting chemotaxis protein [Paenibacillus whitsoniae]|uniref:Methyl-accepting chemotaxis protein n=1 Tax=Paenibacillus whitsoniae TaxID=2496558 RepID=A0A430J5B4_9BACL|nr:methyl-accepting chemotaxis protein [Paenibacillus whitsoniae]RTE02858.1 methyl-accepting chemotaxis protein [Paenibacillus whitsoniae]
MKSKPFTTDRLLPLFKPAVHVMNKLRYLQKFLVIGCMFLIPLIWLAQQVLSETRTELRAADLEMQGLRVQRDLGELLIGLDQYGQMLPSAEGVPAPKGWDTGEIRARIQGILAELQQGAAVQGTVAESEQISAIAEQWKAIQTSGEGMSQNYYELQHQQLELQIQTLIGLVEKNSKLDLDPEEISSNLIHFTVHYFPQFWNLLEKLETKGVQVAARRQIKNPEEQEELIRISGESQSLLAEMAATAAQMKEQAPALMGVLQTSLDNSQQTALAAVAALNEKLVNTGVIQIQATEYAELARAAKTAATAAYVKQIEELESLLQARIDSYRSHMIVDVSIVIVMLLLAAYLFMAFYVAVKQSIDRLAAASRRLVQGDMTARVEADSKDEFTQVVQAFNQIADSFAQVIGQSRLVVERAFASSEQLQASVRVTAEDSAAIQAIMVEMAQGSQVLLRGSVETAAAMNEVSMGVSRIAETSSVVAAAAGDAAEQARQGFAAMGAALEQMASIKGQAAETAGTISALVEVSAKIDAMLNVITDISAQTRLLALNASIEAARAGEHGRGFQVVAAEVRKLADESGESAKGIAELVALIKNSSRSATAKAQTEILEVEKGSRLMNDAGEAFEAILHAVDRVAEQIQEVSAASEEITASTQEVAASMEDSVNISRKASSYTEQVTSSLHKQEASTRETAASSERLNLISNELLQALSRFRLG